MFYIGCFGNVCYSLYIYGWIGVDQLIVYYTGQTYWQTCSNELHTAYFGGLNRLDVDNLTKG